MKTLSVLCLFFLASMLTTKATSLPVTFETGTVNITNFDGGELTVVDNSFSTGINTSAKIAKMVKNTGANWAGSYITLDNAIDFSAGNIFKMKVYSPKIGTKVLLKVQNANDPDINFEKELSTTTAHTWEELSFNYSAIDASQSYRDMVIIFDLGTMGDGSAQFTYYLDDISLEKSEAPLTSAPTPPAYDAVKVISIFSDAFTSIDGTNFNPYWGQTTVGSIEQLENGEVLKLADLNYQGMELPAEVNAAAMKYMHIDVWTADETSLDMYPISRTTGEKKARLAPLTLNAWNSFDINLSDLISQSYNLADLFQMKFIGAGGHTVYIDNLYFYDASTDLDTESPLDFTVSLSTVTYNSIKLLLNATDNSGALNYSITVGDNTVVVGGASGIEKSYEFTRLPSATEFSFSVSASDYYGNAAANNAIQIMASTDPAFPEPEMASPEPPVRDASSVISIFSDAYSNVPNTNFNPYWQQSTWFASKQVGGNEVLKYENFNYQGIEFGAKVNAGNLDYLHIDIWTPNETYLILSPISASSGEKATRINTIALNAWNSYDIPLSTFTSQGLTITDLSQLKLVGSGKSIIYIDNIYFYAGATSAAGHSAMHTEINCYPNPVVSQLKVNARTEISLISVFDIRGKLLKLLHVNTKATVVDVSDLYAGSYIICITLNNGQEHIQKMVKH